MITFLNTYDKHFLTVPFSEDGLVSSHVIIKIALTFVRNDLLAGGDMSFTFIFIQIRLRPLGMEGL